MAHPCARYARPEVRAAQDVVVRVGFRLGQPTMEIGDSGRWDSVPQVGVHRGLVYGRRFLVGESRLEEMVEVRRDDLRVTLRGSPICG